MNKCPHCKLEFHRHREVDGPATAPEDGDVGVCYHCGGWWTLKKRHFVEYIPTAAELQIVTPKLRDARP